MGTSWCGEKVLDCFTLACEKDHVCRVYTVSESAEKESVPRLKIGVWSKIEKAVCFHRRSVRQKHNEKMDNNDSVCEGFCGYKLKDASLWWWNQETRSQRCVSI